MNIFKQIKKVASGKIRAHPEDKTHYEIKSVTLSLKISVLVFTYNRCELLKRALQSLVSQSVPADEVIVIDGGSNDGTKEIVGTFAKVRFVEINERNEKGEFTGSLAHSVNEGFRLAKNELVFLLADDVILRTDCMEILMKDIMANPNCGAWACCFGETEKKLIYGLCDNLLILNMGVISKTCLQKVGGFDEQYRYYGWDIDFSLACWHNGYSIFSSRAGILHFYSPNEMRLQKEPDTKRLMKKFPYSKYEQVSYKRLMKKFKPRKFLIARIKDQLTGP